MNGCLRNRVLGRDDGAMAVVVAILLAFALIGLAAIATDAGLVAQARRQAQSAADAGALAGVQRLPASQSGAEADAISYARENIPPALVTDEDVLGEEWIEVSFEGDPATQVTVEVKGATSLGLARIWGMETAWARASATAIVMSPIAYGAHVVPVGVLPEAVALLSVDDPPIELKFDPGGQLGPGKFGWTSVSMDKLEPGDINDIFEAGGTDAEMGPVTSRPGVNNADRLQPLFNMIATDGCDGAHHTKEYFEKKTRGSDDYTHPSGMDRAAYLEAVELHFREVVTWETGENGFVTINDYDCTRLIVCPVVGNLDLNQDNSIVGFAWFFVYDITGLDTPGSSDVSLWGRFVRPVNPDEPRVWGEYDPYGAIGKTMLWE